MGRAELATALASAAAQDHPSLEIVVIDATGGIHPPLPEIDWCPGHSIRLVGTGQRLIRPLAANAGLDAARGEYFCFLDDDDTYEPHHVSTLLSGAHEHPECLVVYGQTRVRNPAVADDLIFGQPFNRSLMYYGPLFYPQAALFRREALATGCRFDADFEICEDRDFLAQLAEHSDFHYVPIPVFNYRTDLGTSGTGSQSNRNLLRSIAFECRFRAKWAGPSIVHSERAAYGIRGAIAAYHRGDVPEAARRFNAVLAAYPDDPNALHGRARVALVAGDLAGGLRDVTRALELNPAAAEYRLTRAEILAVAGKHEEALKETRLASVDPSFRAAAQILERTLSGQLPPREGSVTSRNEPCPCGSGRRYKHCHGATGAGTAEDAAATLTVPSSPGIRSAIAAFAKGEAQLALLQLEQVDAEQVADAREARWAGDLCDELGDDDRALAFLARAHALRADAETRTRMENIFQRRFRGPSDASIVATVMQMHAPVRAHIHPDAPTRPVVHLVATLANLGGAEVRAMRLFDLLQPFADVRLWSAGGAPRERYARFYPIEELRPELGRHPSGGTVVFCGQYFDWGEWIVDAPLDRIVICDNLDLPDSLLRKLVALAERPEPVPVDLTFPSRMYRDMSGLSGTVEHNPIDLTHFSPSPRRDGARKLTIGRHSRDHRMKHHPNDPSLYRRIAGAGHQVRIMGGRLLARALGEDAMALTVELLAEDAVDARMFLDSLDCYLFRAHPHWVETGGTAILEAMAMALPVIVFRGPIGSIDLIANGDNGFIVDSEAEALERIGELAADPVRRLAIGRAARETMVSTLDAQRHALLSFYLPGIDAAAVAAPVRS